MSEAEFVCDHCEQEVDYIDCPHCGKKLCSLHDYNAAMDMLLQERVELKLALYNEERKAAKYLSRNKALMKKIRGK